jgi:uncharacterized protein GlcG (DUF336 family)
MTKTLQTLTLQDARRLIAAGEAKAAQIGVPYSLAVIDSGGNLIEHVRMDGAWLGSIDISIHKAFTARATETSTEELSKVSQPGGPLFGIHTTNHGKIVIFGGGVPIRANTQVIGAFGASGGSVDQDIEVAEAALRAFAES